MHSLSVTSANIAINHILLETIFLDYIFVADSMSPTGYNCNQFDISVIGFDIVEQCM